MKLKNTHIVTAALVSFLGSGWFVASDLEAKPTWKGHEKCAGVARKGKNDCGAKGHSCSGRAKKDNDPKEWVYVPKGLCKKITGGRVIK